MVYYYGVLFNQTNLEVTMQVVSKQTICILRKLKD